MAAIHKIANKDSGVTNAGNVTEPYKFECNADFLTELPRY